MTTSDDGARRFEALVAPELGRLYRLAYRLTNDVADAEDLVQDVLIKVYRRRDELGSIEALAPWLARILYNQFIDDLRRHRRKRLRPVDADDARAGGSDPDALPDPNPGSTPEGCTAREHDISRVSWALASLSLEHRAVVLLHDAEGYKLEEIHVVTGIPVGTIKSRLHRARARLRELLADLEPIGRG